MRQQRGGGAKVYGCGVGFSEGQGEVNHCIIANNGASTGVNDYGGGIGALNTAGPVVVDTCLVVGNKLTESGGLGAGIGIKNEHVALVVRNCTISGNVATSRSGGILTEGGWGPITLVNSIVADNDAGGAEANLALGHAITSDSKNCLFGLSTEGTSIDGVIYGDPVFVDATSGDYHLGGGSDAIGAGATYAGLGVDLDNVSFAAAPSIGCYEFASNVPPPGPSSWDISGSSGGGIKALDDVASLTAPASSSSESSLPNDPVGYVSIIAGVRRICYDIDITSSERSLP